MFDEAMAALKLVHAGEFKLERIGIGTTDKRGEEREL
jgi:hypothetical protein